VFVRARDAISTAERLVILGFSFGDVNVQRLRFQDCLRPSTEIYPSAYGPQRLFADIQRAFPSHVIHDKVGAPQEDVLAFVHRRWQILERAPIA
jgi:hypothetical protein